MDPIASIVAALAAGANAGLNAAVSQAIKDGYAGLKSLISKKYRTPSVELLEADPKSKARQAVVAEDLEKTGAADDDELLSTAAALLEAIAREGPRAGATAVDLERVSAAALYLKRIRAESHATALVAKDVTVAGEMIVEDVQAVGATPRPKV